MFILILGIVGIIGMIYSMYLLNRIGRRNREEFRLNYTVDGLRERYGEVEQDEGCWQEHTAPCKCGGKVKVEVDLYQTDGGCLDGYYKCDKCEKLYRAAYRIEPIIIIEEVK
jgi:hypothetical protein